MQHVERSLRKKASETTGKGMERARAILAAAREIFARHGYSGLSMRGVATRLGVTLGTVQHYYKTKDELLEAVLLQMLHEYQVDVDRIASQMREASREEQLRESMKYFIGSVLSPLGLGTFVELSALAMRNEFAADVMERIFVLARKSIRRSIRGMVAGLSERELSIRASSIVAQLMGLTFFTPRVTRPRLPELEALEEEAIRTMLAIATRPKP